jgi:competence protein ComEA
LTSEAICRYWDSPGCNLQQPIFARLSSAGQIRLERRGDATARSEGESHFNLQFKTSLRSFPLKNLKVLVYVAALIVAVTFAAPTVSPAAEEPVQVATAAAAPINVNAASVQQLQSLPRIGEVTAQRIVAYREEHGAFKTVDELTQVKGIGAKTLEKLRNLVSVE